jgi:hypothetical protein
MGDYTNIIKCGVPEFRNFSFFLKQYGFLKK